MRQGRPPAQLGSRQRSPISLNRWITSRTASSCAATSWAIAGAGVPAITAAPGVSRSILTVVGAVDCAVQIGVQSGASVTVNPQALILGG